MIARCTQDIRAVDGPIPQALSALTENSMTLVTKIAVIVIFAPIFFSPGVAVAGLGFYLGNLYLKTQLSVKREMRHVFFVLPSSFLIMHLSVMHVHRYWLTSVPPLLE
jgi:hypothetical protein